MINIIEKLKEKGIYTNNDYSFLNQKDFIYIGLSGSYAYGTNIKDSDVDIRCIKADSPESLLLKKDNKINVNIDTDTTVYTINQLFTMWAKGNPNVLELLGDTDRNGLYKNILFEKVLRNKRLFLSKNIFYSFGGFMKSQLNRLNNKLHRQDEETIIENLKRSIEKSSNHLYEEYGIEIGENILLNSNEKLINFQIRNIRLNILPQVLNEISTTCKNAKKLNDINKNQKYVLDHGRIDKHLMHYIRLANMGREILLTGEINTYRKDDHKLLMDIRFNENKQWIDVNDMLTDKAQKLIALKEKELQDAYDNSKLLDKPNQEELDKFIIEINKTLIGGID